MDHVSDLGSDSGSESGQNESDGAVGAVNAVNHVHEITGLLSVPPVRSQHLVNYGPYGAIYTAPAAFRLPMMVGYDTTFRGLLVDSSDRNIGRWTVFVVPNRGPAQFQTLGKIMRAGNFTRKMLVVGQTDGTWAAFDTVSPFSFLSHVVFSGPRMLIDRDPEQLMTIFKACMARLQPNAVRAWTSTYQPANGVNLRTFTRTAGSGSRLPSTDMLRISAPTIMHMEENYTPAPEYDVTPTALERQGSIQCYTFDLKDRPMEDWTHVRLRNIFFFWPRALKVGLWELPWPVAFKRFAIGSVQVTFYVNAKSTVPVWIDRSFLCRVPEMLKRFGMMYRQKSLNDPQQLLRENEHRISENNRLAAERGTTVDEYLRIHTAFTEAKKTRSELPELPNWFYDFSDVYEPPLLAQDVEFYQKIIQAGSNDVDLFALHRLSNSYKLIIKSLTERENASIAESEKEDETNLGPPTGPNDISPSTMTASDDPLSLIRQHERLMSPATRNIYRDDVQTLLDHYMHGTEKHTRTLAHAQAMLDQTLVHLWTESERSAMDALGIGRRMDATRLSRHTIVKYFENVSARAKNIRRNMVDSDMDTMDTDE